MKEKNNILFIITDQQSADMLGCAGNSWVHTPNLDALAARGLRFEGAYCSNPMCVPSRFSMFTGHYGSLAGIHGLPPSERPERPGAPADIAREGLGWAMREAGYETVYAGKRHFPKAVSSDDPEKTAPITAEALGFELIETNEREQLALTAATWLRRRKESAPEKPFFLVTSFINPHDICMDGLKRYPQNDFERMLVRNCQADIAVLEEATKLPPGMTEERFFEEVCPPLPENFEPQRDEPDAIDIELTRRPFRRSCREKWGEREWRLHRWAYANLVRRVDREIGLVLDALKAGGLDESTTVVFTSDHGEMNGSHRLEHKDVLYEENLKVPLIVRPAGGSESDARAVPADSLVCTGLDLFPTFCELAGAEAPAGRPGVSFWPLVEGRREQVRDYVPVESEIGHAVVDSRFKLCRYFEGEPREQLFDLQAEPGEMVSADIADHPADYERLAAAYTEAGLWEAR
ncbi:MAG: sulfatase [Puniceicoccaceae bacterium]